MPGSVICNSQRYVLVDKFAANWSSVDHLCAYKIKMYRTSHTICMITRGQGCVLLVILPEISSREFQSTTLVRTNRVVDVVCYCVCVLRKKQPLRPRICCPKR